MIPPYRIQNEENMARRALIRAIKYTAEALEQHERNYTGKSVPSYIGRAIHKLKTAEAHLNRARAEHAKYITAIIKKQRPH